MIKHLDVTIRMCFSYSITPQGKMCMDWPEKNTSVKDHHSICICRVLVVADNLATWVILGSPLACEEIQSWGLVECCKEPTARKEAAVMTGSVMRNHRAYDPLGRNCLRILR
jgi:hypothetical protein